MSTMQFSCAAMVALVLALGGCGGDDSHAIVPDGPHLIDATPDTAPDTTPSECTATTLANDLGFDPTSNNMRYVAWNETVATDLGGGAAQQRFGLEFWNLTGTEYDYTGGPIDLTAGDQANYSTCEACVLVREYDATGAEVKDFFQSAGTLTVTADPFTGQLTATVSGLQLVEVSIDSSTSTSVVVPEGQCLSFGDLTLSSAQTHPFGWTCDDTAYNDGQACDCVCGLVDPDCSADLPVDGCDDGQACLADACVTTCDVLGGEGCATGTCTFLNDDLDVCHGADTVIDTAALGQTCDGSSAFCGVTDTIAEGLCDYYQVDTLGCTQVCDSDDDCGEDAVCEPVLTVKGICVADAPNDTCDTAMPLALGVPVAGTTAGATDNYNSGLETAACTDYPQAGQDVVYAIDLAAGQSITVDLTNASADFDGSISLLGPGTAADVCGGASVDCLVGADTGVQGEDETFDFMAATGGTYYIIVDSFYAGRGGSYTLTVSAM